MESRYVTQAYQMLQTHKIPDAVGALQAITALGIDHYKTVFSELDFLFQHFQCDGDGWGYWHLGYNTSPNLIISAHIHKLVNHQRALDILLLNEEDNLILKKLNRHRLKMLPRVIDILIDSPFGYEVFDLIASYPPFGNQFFLSGVIASKINYTEVLSGLRKLQSTTIVH